MGQGARVLVLGLDGASWDLVDRFVGEGRMPQMASLLSDGLRAPLNSTMPPMTLPSWSSMLTGTNPGKHGIFDFVQRHKSDWNLEFTNSTHRQVPTLHRILSDRGARVASLCVPTTWPPETLNGVVISGFDSPVSTGIDRSFCRPSKLYEEIRTRFGGLHFADFNECRIGPDWHARARAALLAEIPRKEAIARWLLATERWDLLMLLWGEIDTACHHFWSQSDPESPRHDPGMVGFEDTIREVYQAIDRSMARILDAAEPDLVCICSDHGFGGASAHVLYLNRYLEQCGWLRFAQKSEARRAIAWEGARRSIAARLPHRLQGGLFRALPGRLLDRAETRGRLGAIDLDHSRALSDEMNYAATIRLNIPSSEQRQAVSELEDCLASWEVDGHRVVERVHYREDLYRGPCVSRSPEVILELALRDGYSYTLLSSCRVPRGQTWECLEGAALRGSKGSGMSGSHRQHGVLLFSGGGVPGTTLEQAQMWDIAPSILHFMGENIPDHMDGEALWGDRMIREPIKWVPRPILSLGGEQKAALRGRLQKLGYL